MPTPAQTDAFDALRQVLIDYGLESMSEWMWGQIIQDTPQSSIFLNMRQRPEYIARFPAMKALALKGMAISEDQYINNEKEYKRILRSAGAAPETYNNPQSFTSYFENEISPSELQARADALNLIRTAPITTARMASLFAQYSGLPVGQEDLYNLMLGTDNSLAEEYSQRTGTQLNTETISSQLRKAVLEEQSTFAGGGGNIFEQKGQASGLLTQEEETFL